LPNQQLIIATDKGIFHKMQQAAPGKLLIEAPTAGNGASCKSCAHCPWMAMNGLTNLRDVLKCGDQEILIDESTRLEAIKSLYRMLSFTPNK
jgi:quinolinate synthase